MKKSISNVMFATIYLLTLPAYAALIEAESRKTNTPILFILTPLFLICTFLAEAAAVKLLTKECSYKKIFGKLAIANTISLGLIFLIISAIEKTNFIDSISVFSSQLIFILYATIIFVPISYNLLKQYTDKENRLMFSLIGISLFSNVARSLGFKILILLIQYGRIRFLA